MGYTSDFFAAKPAVALEYNTAFVNSSGPIGSLPKYRFGVIGYGRFGGVVGCGGTTTTRLLNRYSANVGVHGTSVDSTGVAGTSRNLVGVYGQSGVVELPPPPFPTSVHAGVFGAAESGAGVFGTTMFGEGVFGFAQKGNGVDGFSYDGIGVIGQSRTERGVYGISGGSQGVWGHSSYDSGVMGICDTEGPTLPKRPTIAGVVGTSDAQCGVIGTSSKQVGVYGFSNEVGVFGQTSSPNTYWAGYFLGSVYVSGIVASPNPKAAVVPFPDGTQRLLYCMESPEVWFEDFGAARLKGGRAVVKIDADFAKVIKRGNYKVFPTPEGDCRGLYVRRKRAGSFEVRELMGGKSSIAFSYRIVGRRKDIKEHRRFAKIDTRLPVPSRPRMVRPRRRTKVPRPILAGLRPFVARMEKEAQAQMRKRGRKRKRSAT
jgi:hypothetical protein